MRDALSLLDQGIAYGGPGGVTALSVRDMLGLSDRGEIVALFERAMKGEIAEALESMRALYQRRRRSGRHSPRTRRVLPLSSPSAKIAPDAPDDRDGQRDRAREGRANSPAG